jgi:hypothetical protein
MVRLPFAPPAFGLCALLLGEPIDRLHDPADLLAVQSPSPHPQTGNAALTWYKDTR